MLKNILTLFFGAFLMLSCSESFNSIFEDVEVQDPNVVPPGGVDLTNVSILPTLSDPLYAVETTRADGGIFDSWDPDSVHWLNTRFQVFGLRTTNDEGGTVDYSRAQGGDKQFGVLWNQSMGISDQQGHTIFYDSEDKPVLCQYNKDDKLYRYKFFMLGTDGLPTNLEVHKEKIVATKVQLDGKHDILHSFAYHTDEQYEDAVRQLPSDETSKVFLNSGKDNLYNRLSGNRGLHPIFNVNHLLCRFDIYVKGARPGDNSDSGNYDGPDNEPASDFLRVFVKDNVQLRAVNKVDIVVADDAWERDDYETLFCNNGLIRPSDNLSKDETASGFNKLTLCQNEMSPTSPTESLPTGFDISILNAECKAIDESRIYDTDEIQEGVPLIPENSHWVGSNNETRLCGTFLVPPLLPDGGEFEISFPYRYVFMYEGTDGKYHIGHEKGSAMAGVQPWEDFTDRIVVPDIDKDGLPVVYKGGQKYKIVISVYGKTIVKVEVADIEKWQDGGDLNVGGD